MRSRLSIMYLAIGLGQILLAAIVFLLRESGALVTNVRLDVWLTVGALAFATGIALFGIVLFRVRITALSNLAPTDRVRAYKTISLVRLACFEAAGIICIVLYLLDGAPTYLAFLVIELALFGAARPTSERIVQDIGFEE